MLIPSPEVQGLAPDTPIGPEYAPESPDYSPRLPASTEELQEDNYDYDTEDEYGFYDPGPANLEEIIKEYEESRKKMKDDDENDEDNDDDEDENENENENEDEEKKDEPQRTVIEKDFNEGLNLLATEDNEEKDENNSGDEDDEDRKSVTA